MASRRQAILRVGIEDGMTMEGLFGHSDMSIYRKRLVPNYDFTVKASQRSISTNVHRQIGRAHV